MADFTADYVVVGGGLTGCTVASLLSKSDKKPKVILIEAGPDPSSNEAANTFLGGLSLLGGEMDYVYKTEPVPSTANRIHPVNAGKVLGGGSTLNFGGWLRADAGDYDDWASIVDDERWGNKGLSPWIRKIENFHDSDSTAIDTDNNGVNGNMHVFPVSASESTARKYLLREPVKDALSELGVAPNFRKSNGSIAGLTEFYENADPQGNRQPSYKAYPLDKVQVLTNTLVRRVLFNHKRATGVELADGRKITAHNEVILTAGAHRTPQLLMLSGIGPPETLTTHHIPIIHPSPHVGKNLHDHFCVYLAFHLRDPSKGYAFAFPPTHPLWTSNPSLFKHLPWDWVVSEPVPPSSTTDPSHPLIQTARPLYEIIVCYALPGTFPGIPLDGTHIATSTMLLRPTSRGFITIKSDNPADDPVIAPNYLSTDLDRDALVHATRRTLDVILGTRALADIVEGESPPLVTSDEGTGLVPLTRESSDSVIEERIRQTGTQHAHSGGTAAMGTVVDTEGRVLGVEGLRVADASIVPIPVGGHPQATLYAVAERIADFVLAGE